MLMQSVVSASLFHPQAINFLRVFCIWVQEMASTLKNINPQTDPLNNSGKLGWLYKIDT